MRVLRYDPNQPAAIQVGQPWMVQRAWDTINPVFEYDSKYIACNTPGSAATSYIDVEAGDNITAIYWYWLHPTGPMSVWLADCGDSCDGVDVNNLNWFKASRPAVAMTSHKTNLFRRFGILVWSMTAPLVSPRPRGTRRPSRDGMGRLVNGQSPFRLR